MISKIIKVKKSPRELFFPINFSKISIIPKILLNSLLSNEFRSIFSKDVLKRFKTMIDLIDFDCLINPLRFSIILKYKKFMMNLSL